jgi:hypothetical protein
MKKTLQEEKERFHQIVEASNMAYGFKPNENDVTEQIPGPNLYEPEDAYVKPKETKENLYADDYDARRDLEGEQRGEINQTMNKAIVDYMQFQKGKGIPLQEIENDIIEFVKEQTSLLWDENDEGPDANDMDSDGKEYGSSLRYRDDSGTDGG